MQADTVFFFFFKLNVTIYGNGTKNSIYGIGQDSYVVAVQAYESKDLQGCVVNI